MTSSQKNHSSLPFVDWMPAELQATTGENWLIVYYYKIPGTNKMKRFRHRVRKFNNKTERTKFAKRMCANINEKLHRGWSPFFDGTAQHQFKTFEFVIDTYIDQCDRKANDGLLRKESYRAYNSFANNIKDYLKDNELEKMFAVQFDKKFVLNFLDHIYFERRRTARTHNNYLSFLNQLAIFMTDRKFIPSNPVTGLPKRKVLKKKRQIIPGAVKNEIFKYQAARNYHFLCLCLVVYFCFIRRTEITKLKVKHVSLSHSTIFIPADISKNKKDGIVTIPNTLKDLFIKHLQNSTDEDWLFSSASFKSGPYKLNPKKISDEWSLMRNVLGFKKEFQFYSLKDSGITQLFLLNVPLIKIRDQARHHDIKITETYAPRNFEADNFLRDLDFNF